MKSHKFFSDPVMNVNRSIFGRYKVYPLLSLLNGVNFFFKKMEHISPSLAPLIALFCTSGDVYPGFQKRVDSLLAYFLTCMQWVPHIHLCCNNY